MGKRRKKVILGLISLWCLGGDFRAEAAFVSTAADLAAAGGVVTTDATGAKVDGIVMGVLNQGYLGDFTYTGDVEINNTGYNLLQTPDKERTAIRSTTSNLTLGKTTVIWRNDNANTASDVYVYGIKTFMGSTVSLGDGSLIDIEGNTSDSIKGVYAGDNAIGGPGNVNLGDQMKILVKNAGSGYVYGILSYDGANITVGDKLYLEVSGTDDSSDVRGVEVGFHQATAKLGSDATIIAKSDGSYAGGIFAYSGGAIEAKEKLFIQVNSTAGVAHGVLVMSEAKAQLGSNATVMAKSEGSYAYGIFAHSGGVIKASEGLAVQVNSTTDAVGIYSLSDGEKRSEVQLNGATITATGTNNSSVMFADGGKIISQLDSNGDAIPTSKFILNGDMSAANGGLIDLVLGTGSVFIGSANQTTGSIRLKMEAGSKWYVTADKCVDLVMEEGSMLYLGTPQDQIDFALKNVTNTGVMTVNGGTTWFQANVGSSSGDRLVVENVIEGTAGKIAVQNLGGAATRGTGKLVLIEAKNSGAEFTLTNAVEQGGYIYLLGRESDGATGTNWFLYGTRQGTSTGSASVNAFAGGYLLNYAETQTLLQRMGDLRQGEEDRGVWARVYGGKFTSSSDSFLSGFDMTYSGMQVGADKKITLKNKGNIYVGGMFGYSKGNLDYGVGSGSVDSKTLGAYGSYMAPTGFYADLVLKYGWMKNDFKVLDTAGDWVTGDKMNTDGLSASLEVGQRIHFDRKTKEGWYLEPQAQISSGHQSGGSFTASNGLQVDVDSYTSTLGRLGINAGYEVKSGKNPINVYAKVSYVHEFDGDVGYRLNGSSEQTSFGDSWWTYGVGITAQINKKHNVYLDVERASGGQFNQPWSLNGGYRFNW